MTIITDSASLADFCRSLKSERYVTVDTEFMRESTYYPRVCLIQIAGAADARAIDPLAEGIDLGPLFDLLSDPAILKVFHAARQDLEIFLHLMGRLPAPLFDTQIAAMVCGFGEQAGYETLVNDLAKASVDKSSRFTDWSKRPLSDRQIAYALSDVTYLRIVYEKLSARIEKTGRAAWLEEEMAQLGDPASYVTEPQEAWRRLKPRSGSGRLLAVLQAAAAWREREAQARDIPRNRLLRDEALLELAAHPPQSVEDLLRIRGMGKGLAEGRSGQALLEAVASALAAPKESWPRMDRGPDVPRGIGPLVELLRVLLKLKCDEHGVAQKLIASGADLDLIAAATPEQESHIRALQGWRGEIFGQDALALKAGKLALAAEGHKIKLVRLG